jgi:hypothetical protein
LHLIQDSIPHLKFPFQPRQTSEYQIIKRDHGGECRAYVRQLLLPTALLLLAPLELALALVLALVLDCLVLALLLHPY